MRNLIISSIIVVILFSSCSKKRTYYKDGNLKEIYHVKDHRKDGLYKLFYKNGKVKEKHNYNQGKKIDSSMFFYNNEENSIKRKIKYLEADTTLVYNYHENGKKESFGNKLPNKNMYGWWKFYETDGRLSKNFEILNIDGKKILNRAYIYDDEGDDSLESNYYIIQTASNTDTVKINEVKNIRIILMSPFFSMHSNPYIVIGKGEEDFNQDFSNKHDIKLDTIKNTSENNQKYNFFAPNLNFVISLMYSKIGKKHFRGIIIEEDPEYVANDTCRTRYKELYFDKELIVVE